jgi:CheY-like chemotaxis protein
MKPKVLLVEDNENNRYLATFLLERAGFTVVAARNGREALALAARELPHLVVMDIQMPEMDGYETAARLKQEPALAQIPIIGVSSFVMPGDREKAMHLGFARYIEKPINSVTFGEEIRSFLRPGEPRP